MEEPALKTEQYGVAAQWLTAEILSEVLASSGPTDLADKLSEQLRELTGAKTVLVLIHRQADMGHYVLGACPQRRANLFSTTELVLLSPDRTPDPLPSRTADFPQDHPLRAMLDRAGVSSLVRFCLLASGELVGSIILLDLPDLDRINSAGEAISLLSSPIAFALKNALAHERAEAKYTRELQETNQSLREKNELVQQIINCVHEGIIAYSPDLRYQLWNPFMERKTGIPASEILGRHPLDVFPFLKDVGVLEGIERALAGEPSGPVDFRYSLTEAGPTSWASNECSPLRDSDGRIIGAIATVRDITERTRAKEALLESEQKLRSIIEHSNEVFYTHDTEHGLTYVSPQCEQVFGYTPAEMQRNWTELVTDNPLNEAGIEFTETAIRTGRRQPPYVLEAKTKDGRIRFVEIDESPIVDENGNVVGVSGAVHDITDRKRVEDALRESEELHRTVVSAAHEGIILQANTGRILAFNATAERVFGLTAEEAMQETSTSRDWGTFREDGSVFPGAEHPSMYTLRTGEPCTDVVMQVRSPEGDFWINVNTSPLFKDGESLPYAVVISFSDTTARRQAEEQLRQSQKMEAIGQLASGVAHEFNNLLFGILGGAELIVATHGGELSEDLDRPLRDIKKCAQRGAALTKQLLAFARKKAPEVSVFDINRVVGELDSILRRVGGETITLEVDLAADLGPVEADRAHVEQSIMNLARNACDAMPDGGTLTIRTVAAQLDEARISGTGLCT